MKPAVDQLRQLGRTELIALWRAEFKQPPPYKSRDELLRQLLAWQLQAQAQGGLKASVRRQLKHGGQTQAPLAVGSRLIRVWRGDTHQVTVMADGFLYADTTWKSLSAIAKAITGTAWSGPVFFGLRP